MQGSIQSQSENNPASPDSTMAIVYVHEPIGNEDDIHVSSPHVTTIAATGNREDTAKSRKGFVK